MKNSIRPVALALVVLLSCTLSFSYGHAPPGNLSKTTFVEKTPAVKIFNAGAIVASPVVYVVAKHATSKLSFQTKEPVFLVRHEPIMYAFSTFAIQNRWLYSPPEKSNGLINSYTIKSATFSKATKAFTLKRDRYSLRC